MLGLKLLDILELIHDSGLVYNDLKPDNILIGNQDFVPELDDNSDQNIFADIDINLIDFGMASRWRDNGTGRHCERN